MRIYIMNELVRKYHIHTRSRERGGWAVVCVGCDIGVPETSVLELRHSLCHFLSRHSLQEVCDRE